MVQTISKTVSLQFKEFLDFITTHASIIKVFIQRDHQLIFNQLNFLLESPIAMKQFQNIRFVLFYLLDLLFESVDRVRQSVQRPAPKDYIINLEKQIVSNVSRNTP